jgi:hypothetical protein
MYPDLIWSALGAIGGLLLIDSLPNTKAKAGVDLTPILVPPAS